MKTFCAPKSSCDGTLLRSVASYAMMDSEIRSSSLFRVSCAASKSGFVVPMVGELILTSMSHVKYSMMDWKMVDGVQRPDGKIKGPRIGLRNRGSPFEGKDKTLPIPSGASV